MNEQQLRTEFSIENARIEGANEVREKVFCGFFWIASLGGAPIVVWSDRREGYFLPGFLLVTLLGVCGLVCWWNRPRALHDSFDDWKRKHAQPINPDENRMRPQAEEEG